MDSAGWGDGVDWGLVEVTPASNDYLAEVNIWVTSSPASYEIYVYDDFNGSQVSNLLSGPVSGGVTDPGFYTVDLPMAVWVTSGNPVYIAVCFSTPGYPWPIPYDDYGTMETNKSFASNTGTTYSALDAGSYNMGDIGNERPALLEFQPPSLVSEDNQHVVTCRGEHDTRVGVGVVDPAMLVSDGHVLR